MKALDLYKYINDNKIEWHYREDTDWNMNVIIFPHYFQLEEFSKLFHSNYFDDIGIDCVLKHNYVGIWMGGICEYHDIELDEVFPKSEEEK